MRVTQDGAPDVWLIFHGRRHRIGSPEVYDSLFTGVEGVVALRGVNVIAAGPELSTGTCLVRAEGSLGIYLIARSMGGQVRRHLIPTYESMLGFGFDEQKVRTVPPLMVEGLASGPAVVSAADHG